MPRKPEEAGGKSGGRQRPPAVQGRKPTSADPVAARGTDTGRVDGVGGGSDRAVVGKAPATDRGRERLGSLTSPLGSGSRGLRPVGGVKLEEGGGDRSGGTTTQSGSYPLTVKKERDTGDLKPSPSALMTARASASEATAGSSNATRKVKFAPKVPARRVGKPRAATGAAAEEDFEDPDLAAEFRDLLNQSQEALLDRGSRRPLPDKKPGAGPVRVAFGFGSTIAGRAGGPHSAFGGFGGFGGGTRGSFHGFDTKKHFSATGGGAGAGGGASSSKQGTLAAAAADGTVSMNTTAGKDDVLLIGGSGAGKLTKIKKDEDYIDYTKYFPTTLPMRNPFEDEEEDELEPLEEGRERPFDENAVPAADELELRNEGLDDRLLFIQLPTSLPLAAASDVGAEGGEKNRGQNGTRDAGTTAMAGGTKAQAGKAVAAKEEKADAPGKGKVKGTGLGGLANLPPGMMGKLIIYESGAIQFRVGDVLMDVEAGSQCKFHQELVAVDVNDRKCYFFGDVSQRMDFCPNVDNLLGKASAS